MKDFRHENMSGCCILKKGLWAPFMDGVQLFRGYESRYEEIVYILTINPQKFLVLNLSTLEG